MKTEVINGFIYRVPEEIMELVVYIYENKICTGLILYKENSIYDSQREAWQRFIKLNNISIFDVEYIGARYIRCPEGFSKEVIDKFHEEQKRLKDEILEYYISKINYWEDNKFVEEQMGAYQFFFDTSEEEKEEDWRLPF